MADSKALRTPIGLQVTTGAFLLGWTLVALFPLVWIALMSFRVPLDALSSNPMDVVIGPKTRAAVGGVSLLDLAVWCAALVAAYIIPARYAAQAAVWIAPGGNTPAGYILVALGYLAAAVLTLVWVMPFVATVLNRVFAALPLLDALALPRFGVTFEHYKAVWIQHAFYRNFLNSMLVTFGVVTVSLTVGTLAGYALARAHSNLAFWLLLIALIFRALPHSVLVTGYIPPFVGSREFLAPLWEWVATGWFFRLFAAVPPTLYGQPWAIIIVLVSINQPFTIWMMRSFFQNIPSELDEAARVDGCTHFEAFWRVIMPVMWPGVITTGLFSFLLAYNDYIVTALLLDAQSQTMVPGITQFLNRDIKGSDQIEAIAAAVSITAPLFLLVMVFQKQIVSGLTQGAVKG
jgi:trehalose/maltose transport system permease protein